MAEYLTGDASYRELSAKYGYSAVTIYRWVKASEEKKAVRGKGVISGEALLGISGEQEIKRLRKELKKAELHNKVLNKMMDIARDEMGVDIRKKYGPGQ